jgi:putative glutamine amidotransferase
MAPSRRPVIGVAWPKADYLASLERAGAETRELAPDRDPLPDALDACDGLLLTGGPDVDPAAYGQAERHPTVELDPLRDAYELALARQALARDLPVLAICRGAQVLNVAAGGTLVQDLPSARPTSVPHAVNEPAHAIAHDVRVVPGTGLARLLAPGLAGGEALAVNSRHHQSVDEPAPGFIVSAAAGDGTVEAIERPEARFCVGVQWHPENFWRTGEFTSLFEGLAAAARQYRASARGEESSSPQPA